MRSHATVIGAGGGQGWDFSGKHWDGVLERTRNRSGKVGVLWSMTEQLWQDSKWLAA